MPRGKKGKMALPSTAPEPSPQDEGSEAERSKNLGLEVVQFMGSPAGWALATVAAGLVISWLVRRPRPPDSETGPTDE
jgi:hypothetical protein